jgi:hypothetical protein
MGLFSISELATAAAATAAAQAWQGLEVNKQTAAD